MASAPVEERKCCTRLTLSLTTRAVTAAAEESGAMAAAAAAAASSRKQQQQAAESSRKQLRRGYIALHPAVAVGMIVMGHRGRGGRSRDLQRVRG